MENQGELFTKFLDENWQVLYACAKYWARRMNCQADAMDILQEALVACWIKVDQINFGNVQQALGYFRKAIERKAIDCGRKTGRRRETTLQKDVAESRSTSSPSDNLVATEDAKRIREVLAGFKNPNMQNAVLLMEGRSYQEIANLLGVTVRCVTNWIHRARKRFIRDLGFDPLPKKKID